MNWLKRIGLVAGFLILLRYLYVYLHLKHAEKKLLKYINTQEVKKTLEFERKKLQDKNIHVNLPALTMAHAIIESGGNEKARGSVGEIGLMQIKLSTARDYLPNVTENILYIPTINLQAGIMHISRLLQVFDGDIDAEIHAYNVGEGAYRKGKRNNKYHDKVKKYYEKYTALFPEWGIT